MSREIRTKIGNRNEEEYSQFKKEINKNDERIGDIVKNTKTYKETWKEIKKRAVLSMLFFMMVSILILGVFIFLFLSGKMSGTEIVRLIGK